MSKSDSVLGGLIYCQLKIEWILRRKKDKIKTTFTPALPSSRAQFHSYIPSSSTSFPPLQSDGGGRLQSVHQTLSLPISSSCCSSTPEVGSVLHWVFSTGRSPLRTHCSSLVHHGPLLLLGLLFPSGNLHLQSSGVPHGMQSVCSTMDLHGLPGDNLPHHGHLHRLQVNLCSSTCSTSSTSCPCSFTRLGASRAISLTEIALTLSYTCFHRGATSVTDRASFGQGVDGFGAGCHWLCLRWSSTSSLLNTGHPCSSSLPKPCQINLIHLQKCWPRGPIP